MPNARRWRGSEVMPRAGAGISARGNSVRQGMVERRSITGEVSPGCIVSRAGGEAGGERKPPVSECSREVVGGGAVIPVARHVVRTSPERFARSPPRPTSVRAAVSQCGENLPAFDGCAAHQAAPRHRLVGSCVARAAPASDAA